jgi:hypothetical protein
MDNLSDYYKKLIDPILDKYIELAEDTKKHIIYKVEPDNEEDPLDEYDAESDDEDDDADPTYKVKVYKASKRLYVLMFNNLYTEKFDKWLLSRVIGASKANCIIDIIIDENELEEKKDDYLEQLTIQLTNFLKPECVPFVIFNIILIFKNKSKHANTLIIQYSEDYSNILMIYYEPHGSVAPAIHKRINIHNILNFIKNYIVNNKKKTKVEIIWGLEEKGIQNKDRVGFCHIFTRFWTYITLQLLKLCKDKDNSCVFSKLLLKTGESLLQEKVKNKFPEEPDKDYDVIISWMYRMIGIYLSENTDVELNKKKQRIINYITESCSGNKSRECTIDHEYLSATKFYERFKSELKIPKTKNIEDAEEYINRLINSENDLPLKQQLNILKKRKILKIRQILGKKKSLKETNIEIKKLEQLIINDEKEKEENDELIKELKYDIEIVPEEIQTLTNELQTLTNDIERLTNEIKLQKENEEELTKEWEKLDKLFKTNKRKHDSDNKDEQYQDTYKNIKR